MFKYLIIAFFTIGVVFAQTQSDTIELTPKEKAWLNANLKITMVVPKNFPRSYLNKAGKLEGMDIDYFNLIEKKLGIKFDKKSLIWHTALDSAMNYEVDIISNAAKLKSRETKLSFTQVYFTIPQAVVAFDSEVNISDLNDLCGKKVAVHKGSAKARYLQKNYPCIKLIEVIGKKEILSSVVTKKAYAGFDNFDSLSANIKKNFLSGLKIIYLKYIPPLGFARVGIRKDKPMLTSIIDKAISSISIEEENKIVSKWLNVKLPSISKESKKFKETKLFLKEKEYLKKKKQIKMCIDPDWMPFEKIENGKHIGLASNYIKILEKAINIPITLVETKNWDESVQKAKNRECDMFSMVPIIEERKKYMNFTSSFLDIPMVIATKTDKHFIDNIEQIVDKKIGIVKSYSIANILKEKYPNINIVDVESISDGLLKVENGNIFALIDNLATINYMINKKFMGTLKVSGRLDTRLQYRVATRNDEPILNTIFDKVIKNIDASTKEKIFNKWVNSPTKETIIDYNLVWQIIMVSLIIVFIISIAYLKIKKLNDSLEERVDKEVKRNKQQQLMMLRQNRLAQMGEMISMIAHQWRQPLNSLSILNQTIVLKYSRDKLDKEFLEYFDINSNKQIQGMSKTIDDFRNFFKPEKEKVEFVINDVINDTLDMVKPIFSKDQIIIKFKKEDKYKVFGYPNELGQAILNIINNARDALIENSIENKNIFISLSGDDNKVILTIKDNAGGIPTDVIDKIFDPYFSTKEEKNGTGLGLYMSKLIIDDHMNGKIQVSNKDNGALFEIILREGESDDIE